MIFNIEGAKDNSEEIALMLTQFMDEVNETLASFESGINTSLAGFKSEVNTTLASFTSETNTKLTTLANDIDSDIATLNTNMNTKFTSLTSTVNSIPKGAVKSVQRGVHEGTATGNATISINAVNPSKCIVLLQRVRDTTNLPSLVSISSTSFIVTTSSAVYSSSPNAPSPFSWQVVEFY